MGFVIPVLDDSYLSHRLVCAPYARNLGITLGFAMIPGMHTANIGRLNVQQAREIQDVFGHECYTHACTGTDHDNATLFTEADGYQAADVSISRARAMMRAQGLNENDTATDVFVAPPGAPQYGDTNHGQAAHALLVRQGFKGRRGFTSAFPSVNAVTLETCPPMNPWHIRTAGHNGHAVSSYRDLITRTRLNPYAAAVLVFHDVMTSGASGVSILTTDWQAIMTEIAFQRDNNYQSDQSAGTAAGKLRTATLSQLIRGQLAPTV